MRAGRHTWAEIRSLSTADRNLGLPGLQTVWRLRTDCILHSDLPVAVLMKEFREIDVHGMNPITMVIRKVSCVLKARLWCSLENERVPLHR